MRHQIPTRCRGGRVMTSRLVEVPLALNMDFPGYKAFRFDFSTYPCPALARDLVRALYARTDTRGSIKSPLAVRAYKLVIGDSARWFAARGFDGDASELTDGLVSDYWRVCGIDDEITLSIFLSDLEAATPPRLFPGNTAPTRQSRLGTAAQSRRSPDIASPKPSNPTGKWSD